MTNVVTLELTGDESSLATAIQQATQQVQGLDTTVGTAAGSIENSTSRIDRMAERADNLATRTGTLAGGIGALAGGMALLGVDSDSTAAKIVGGLSVAIGTLSGIADIAAIALTSQKVALAGQKIAAVASTVATSAQTAATWALNSAFLASPITWVVAGILVLIGVIVLIATKTTWFQTAWNTVWGGVKAVASGFMDWFKGIPNAISTAFSGLVNIILWPYKTAFNLISDAWNNTVGKLQWTVPSWVPGIGGNTVGAPKLPHWYHSGGMVTGGPEGSDVLAVLQVGERVQTREMQARESGGNTYHITVNGTKFRDGTDFQDWLDGLRNDGRGGDEVAA